MSLEESTGTHTLDKASIPLKTSLGNVSRLLWARLLKKNTFREVTSIAFISKCRVHFLFFKVQTKVSDEGCDPKHFGIYQLLNNEWSRRESVSVCLLIL